MKKLLVVAVLLIGSSCFAQATYGIKGGFNYGGTGDISYGFQDITTNTGSNKTGFHLGGFTRFGMLGVFIQPELVYTRLTTEYDRFDYSLSKIDAPILVGLNLLGPVNIKAGPSFQYILKNQLENSELRISNVDKDITLGYQLGAGVNIGKIGIDVRYEGAFTENTAFSNTASENFSIDSRPTQWIFSLAYSFN